jgi:hypothetical protein
MAVLSGLRNPRFCMSPKLHQIAIPTEVLRRGFWLYVWQINLRGRAAVYYVGRTGDSSSLKAQSPFSRVSGHLEHFPLMLIHSLRVGRNWRILADKRREGANEFCARGPGSSAQPPFAAVL